MIYKLNIRNHFRLALTASLTLFSFQLRGIFLLFSLSQAVQAQEVDSASGLIVAEHLDLVRANCTGCHSAAIITQHGMSREVWLERIRWMQDSQGLWPLGPMEEPILDYLETHYGEKVSSRRAVLSAELQRL